VKTVHKHIFTSEKKKGDLRTCRYAAIWRGDCLKTNESGYCVLSFFQWVILGIAYVHKLKFYLIQFCKNCLKRISISDYLMRETQREVK
jgi:hypothetical protein